MVAHISKFISNPTNPRYIRDEKFALLVKSIKAFPEMLNIRPIVAVTEGDKLMVLGGNMRLKACIEAGVTELPYILADNLTEAQRDEFIIKDNLGFGDWDWDSLANNWDSDLLKEWGMDIPGWETPEETEQKATKPTMNITFDSPEQLQKAEIDIAELIDRKYRGATFVVKA